MLVEGNSRNIPAVEFREIRRKKEISTEAAEALIRCGRRGILAVNRENSCPYAVSINNLHDGD